MTLDLFIAIAAYAFVTTITPGPNNAMLLASGLTFGFWRTGPHILGIALGFSGMVAAVGFGAGELFELIPHLHEILRVIATVYLLYLAWRIAHSAPMTDGDSDAGADRKPFSFLQAAAFQWVNPKAWVMSIGAISTYSVPTEFSLSVIVIALAYLIIGSPCIALWAGFGSVMRRLMRDPRRLRQINIGMAVLLAISALYPLLAEVL